MPDADGRLVFGDDYDLERWTAGDRDESGHIIWHHTYPSNAEWDRVRMVTVDFDPQNSVPNPEGPGTVGGNYRNIPISPDEPLDPYGSDDPNYRGPHKGGRYGPEYYYDLDDLATNFYWSTDTP